VKRVVFVIVILAIVAGVAGATAWRWSQRGPGHASVNRAIDRFRSSSTIPGATSALQPRSGVYVYHGSGKERLSFLQTEQRQGPVETGTVSRRPDGCSLFAMDFNSFHSQSWLRCASNGQLVERGGTADQKFDFVAFTQHEHSVTTCTPPIVEFDPAWQPGATAPVRCHVTSSTTKTTSDQSGVFTYLGRTVVDVGGTGVAAIHGRQEVHLRGGQTGTVRIEIWLAADSALPLRETHSIEVVSSAPAPINHVTYTELGQWQLTSLVPST
jgi:hypothetical protein